jgi:hypothetical protein
LIGLGWGRKRTSLARRSESITIMPVITLSNADRCPVNLAPAASRRPMALPTRVEAATPAWVVSEPDANTDIMIVRAGALPMPNGMEFKT